MDASNVKQAGVFFKNGKLEEARNLLAQTVRENPKNVNAWIALSQCYEDVEVKRNYLQYVLSLEPDNKFAKELLEKITTSDVPIVSTKPVTPELIKSNVGSTEIKPKTEPVPDHIASLYPDDFEKLIGAILEAQKFSVHYTGDFGDHGIDLISYDEKKTKCLVQCKRWKGKVGEHVLRDLYGAMASEQAPKGAVYTTGIFSDAAWTWVRGKPIDLYDGNDIMKMIQKLNDPHVTELLIEYNEEAEREDNKRCPKCGGDLVLRRARKGKNEGGQFWGCSNWPRCHYILETENRANDEQIEYFSNLIRKTIKTIVKG